MVVVILSLRSEFCDSGRRARAADKSGPGNSRKERPLSREIAERGCPPLVARRNRMPNFKTRFIETGEPTFSGATGAVPSSRLTRARHTKNTAIVAIPASAASAIGIALASKTPSRNRLRMNIAIVVINNIASACGKIPLGFYRGRNFAGRPPNC